MNTFSNLTLLEHPLIQHKLTEMRRKSTEIMPFRELLKEIAMLMGYEVTRNLPLRSCSIETPLEKMVGRVVNSKSVALVPILRAGLGMLEGLLALMPFAQVGHLGLYRDPETHRPIEYLRRLPPLKGQLFFLLDPMIATGHSAVHGVQVLLDYGVPREKILFLALLASPEGMTVFNETCGDIPVFAAALDRELNEKNYLLPGLGDAGDRLFGTL